MDLHLLHTFLFTLLLLLAKAVDETRADAMVSGNVFCDQCKDGQRSFFDYPLYGVKVVVACTGNDGQVATSNEVTTDWFGNYAMRFDGTPDMSNCYAQISGSSQGSTGCAAAAGPPQRLRQMFNMFNMEMFVADSLLSQPAQPMPFCPRAAEPPPRTIAPPVLSPPPALRFPPMPPLPFLEASACTYQMWAMPEHICHWKVVGPDTKVAVAFGLIAARRYGTDMTLRGGLQGRGDLYRTLLREATTALLNSYHSLTYRYPTLAVVSRMNWALVASPQQALTIALRFKWANSGYGKVACNLTPCK